MAGYWPRSFFACLWTSTSVHKHAKKELGQYPAILTEQAWSITHTCLFLSRRTLRCAANEQNECEPSARKVPPVMYVLHTWQEQTFDKLVDCSRLGGLV